MQARFPRVSVQYVAADFTRLLDLPPLDGLLMANSLHFVAGKPSLLPGLIGYLKPGGRFVLVEYNADRSNTWVPYPLSFPGWQTMAEGCGLIATRLLATVPSVFPREIYSALSFKPAMEGPRL